MREQLIKIRNNKYMFGLHMLIYVAMIVYSVFTFITVDKSMAVGNFVILLIVLSLLIICDMISHIQEKPTLQQGKMGMGYHAIRFIVCIIVFATTADNYNGYLFLFVSLLFAAEFALLTKFDELVTRIGCYFFFAIVYGIGTVVFCFRLYEMDFDKVSTGVQQLATALSIMAMLAIVIEIIAGMYNYFEQQIFSQNRMVRELNDANEVMQAHQEKINQVNELLGLQKIELQSANKKINRSHDEMSVQNEISSTIAASLGKEDMLEKVARIMHIRLDMNTVMIILEPDDSLLAPGETSKGRFVALTTNIGKEYEEGIRKSVLETDLKEMLLLSKTYIQNSATDSTKFFQYLEKDLMLPSIICIPIYNQGERLGTLFVGKNKENAFMDSRAFYENIASQLSIGISNARLYAKMNDMAIRDGLTRIYNRRKLTEILTQYIADAMNQKIPVSLALFDIDKFKMINDTYGHQCGDVVICHVATLLNRCALQYGGIAGRYGGEEFVIAFFDKDLDSTYAIVKEVHDKIREEIVTFGNKEINVRASAGIASYPATCSNPGDLLNRADWAMYNSKKNGRDQITIDSDQIADKM